MGILRQRHVLLKVSIRVSANPCLLHPLLFFHLLLYLVYVDFNNLSLAGAAVLYLTRRLTRRSESPFLEIASRR